MLKEIAITPEVWTHGAFSSSQHADLALSALWKGVERGAVVRNLRGGEWLKAVESLNGQWHPRAKEVLRKISRRIVSALPAGPKGPSNEAEWVTEAIASHQATPEMCGVFSTDAMAATLLGTPNHHQIIRGTSKLPFCEPFSGGGCSVKLKRDVQAYVDTLRPVFKYSNVIAFIDPFLSPDALNYRDFSALLRAVARTNPRIKVELHRELKDGNLPLSKPQDWVDRFRATLRSDVALAGLPIQVNVWSSFHDRYLASDLIGLSVPYGFDTTTNPNDTTRWTQLSRDDRDDVFAEFSGSDPEKRRNRLLSVDI